MLLYEAKSGVRWLLVLGCRGFCVLLGGVPVVFLGWKGVLYIWGILP